MNTPTPFLNIQPEKRFYSRLDAHLGAVEATIQSVFRYAQRKARHLSETLGRDPDYYLGFIFDRCALLHPMSRYSNSDPWELPKDTTVLDELRKEFNDEFDTLSSDDRLTLSNYLKKYDPESSMAIRSLPSDRVADVDILFDTLKGLFLLLKCRCGVDGFICIARNTHSFDIFPKWYFSEPGISTYLLDYVDIWDEGAIGFHVEKFSLSVSPDRYATWMRKEIESKVDLLLVYATRRKTIRMDYENYDKAIVIDLGVELVGWSHPTFAHPSTLPAEIKPLETLLRDLMYGTCYFQPLTDSERADRLRDYMERMGQVEAYEQARSGSEECREAGAESEDGHQGVVSDD